METFKKWLCRKSNSLPLLFKVTSYNKYLNTEKRLSSVRFFAIFAITLWAKPCTCVCFGGRFIVCVVWMPVVIGTIQINVPFYYSVYACAAVSGELGCRTVQLLTQEQSTGVCPVWARVSRDTADLCLTQSWSSSTGSEAWLYTCTAMP